MVQDSEGVWLLMDIVHDLRESVERKLKVCMVEWDALKISWGGKGKLLLCLTAIQRGVGRRHGGFVNFTRVNPALCGTHCHKH